MANYYPQSQPVNYTYGYTSNGAYHQPQTQQPYNGSQNPCNGPCRPPCPHQPSQPTNTYQTQNYPNQHQPNQNGYQVQPNQIQHHQQPNQNQSNNQPTYNQYQYPPQQPTLADNPPPYTQYPQSPNPQQHPGLTTQNPSSTISTPANGKSRAHCKKVHHLNGCGHKEYGVTYLYCGSKEHNDNHYANEKCYHRRWQPSKSMKVRTGTGFCNNACHASVSGWTCCQCRILVHGK